MGLRRFWHDERGTSFEGIALSVSIIAVGFVASADMLDYMAKSRHASARSAAAVVHNSGAPTIATAAPASAGVKDGLDETPTASLPALIERSVLDPCKAPAR